MIIVTVGSVLPFDRLIEAIDKFAGSGDFPYKFLAQIGVNGTYTPQNMDFVRLVPRIEMNSLMASASAVVCHAGIGTINESLRMRLPTLVVPRRVELGEVTSDHQLGTAREFARLGHLLMCDDPSEVASMLPILLNFRPSIRTPNVSGLSGRIDRALEEWFGRS